MLRIAVLGATGRMGQTLTRLIAENAETELVGAATEPNHERIGEDAGLVAGVSSQGVIVTDNVNEAVVGSQVAIDFTLPEAASANLAACVEQNVAMVMGTTGLSAEQQQALEAAAQHIGVVYGRNMSIGVNVLTELVRLAAKNVEISEAHHRNKIDAPSGTALQLGDVVARERGTTLDAAATYDCHGARTAREPGTIGFTSIRAGGIVGEHTVLFATGEEIVEFKHRATDRALFARGALRAAQWVIGQPAGLYGMADVLGLRGR